MNEVIQTIAQFVSRESGLPADEAERIVEVPRDPQWGDYAFPCFSLAKIRRKSPQALSQEMARKFQPEKLLTHCTPEGAYLNFRIRRDAWAEIVLHRVFSAGEDYGKSFCATPEGELLDQPSGPNEGVVMATVDLLEIERTRRVWTFLRDRRPEMYKELLAG